MVQIILLAHDRLKRYEFQPSSVPMPTALEPIISVQSASIYDLPLEPGGRESRQGFDFQDHVAAGLCLDMLQSPELLEVWCESQDDVTLLWNTNGSIAVEFVQVKGADMESRWSIAELTRGDGKAPNRKPSLLEQSLGRAKCRESVLFRIVTYTDVTPDLTVLKRRHGSLERDPQKIAALQRKVDKRKLVHKTSLNGTTASQWIERCLWEKRDSREAQEHANKFRLGAHVKTQCTYLLSIDHINEIYIRLLNLIKAASDADLENNPDAFKIRHAMLETWLKETVDRVLFNMNVASNNKMRVKMKRCMISEDIIEKAVQLRFAYLDERYRAGYSTVTPFRRLELKVLARLQLDKVALETGAITESGIQFHARCLESIERLRQEWSDKASCPDSALFQGYMYELTNRCQHTFDVIKA